MEAIQPKHTFENLAISLVFRHEFSNFIHLIHNDPKSYTATLLTCKTWQIILTKELCNEMQGVFRIFESNLKQKIPGLKKRLSESASFDNSLTFRQLNISCLLRLREIQESIFAEERFRSKVLKKALDGFCLQTGIHPYDLKVKLFDDIEPCDEDITLEGIQKTYDALQARSIKHLDEKSAALLMKSIEPSLEIRRIELTAPEYFKRVTSYPYRVSKSLPFINKKSRLFEDKRFAIIVNFAFSTPSEDALLFSEMSNSQLMEKIKTVFLKGLEYRIAIQKIWTHISKDGRQKVRKLFIEQALSFAQGLMRSYRNSDFEYMRIFFENEPEAKQYRDLSFDLKCHQKAFKEDIEGYISELRGGQVRLFQHNISQRSEYIERLFKIMNLFLQNKCYRKILETIQLMLPPQNYVLTKEDTKLLDSLFSPSYLAQFFPMMIALLKEITSFPKARGIHKLTSLYNKNVYDLEFFNDLQQLLAFRFTTLKAVFDEGGLHCSFIKACVASQSIGMAKDFIDSEAIIGIQQTYAKEIRKKLHIYLKKIT